MKTLLILGTLLLAGCATSVTRTLQEAKQECNDEGTEVQAIIKNVGGEESLRVSCKWVVPVF